MSSDLVAICDRAIAYLEAERAERLAKAKDAGLVFADNGDRIEEQFREMADDLEAPADEQPKPRLRMDDRCGSCGCPRRSHGGRNECIGWDDKLTCDCRGWQEPSEQPKPPAEQAQQPARRVARTVRREGVPEPVTLFDDDLDDIGKARLPQQPAPVDVPPMPQVLGFEETVDGPDFGCAEDAVRALHAACVRIAQERDEARRELEAERAGRPGSINAMTITSLRERLAEAEAELAALKGQEPFGWWWIEDGIMHEPSRTRFTKNCAGAPRNAVALYAAPVPPPDTLHDKSVLQLMQDCERLAKECDKAKAQHDAEVAQARREERERCAVVADENGAIHTARAIRALADKGGEVGKP